MAGDMNIASGCLLFVAHDTPLNGSYIKDDSFLFYFLWIRQYALYRQWHTLERMISTALKPVTGEENREYELFECIGHWL